MEIRHASVEPGRIGRGVVVVEPTNIYGANLGDEVFVGPFCEIQAGVHIGARSRVQSHSFICELVAVGEDCFIGHGVVFVNDLLRGGPARGDRDRWAETLIGDRVSIGSKSTVLPVRICSDVVVGAGSVVTRDIEVPGTYFGNPARREFR